jgi:hypothetical protein
MAAPLEDAPLVHVGIEGLGRDSRLDLDVRRLTLDRESAALDLPADAGDLLRVWVSWRERGLEARYMAVVIDRTLRAKGAFWEGFGEESIGALLGRVDFPDRETISEWARVVDAFSRDTYLLVGHETLALMMKLVRRHQKEPESQRRDYRAIFDAYTAQYPTLYDAVAFLRHVHVYVNRTYVSALHVVKDETARPKAATRGARQPDPTQADLRAAYDELRRSHEVALAALRRIAQYAARSDYGPTYLGRIAEEALAKIEGPQ